MPIWLEDVIGAILGFIMIALTILIGIGAVLIGLFVMVGPLLLACYAALTGHVMGAVVLIVIQFILWAMLD